MAEPYLGEIRVFSFAFPPRYWAFCNGQLLPRQQNKDLYNLIGFTYGGDPVNFKLPNLQGRTPMHMGGAHSLADVGGSSTHLLTMSEMPPAGHTHTFNASTDHAITGNPTAATPAIPDTAVGVAYAPADANKTAMLPAIMQATGGAAHTNMQPYLVVNFCIALSGIIPSRP